MSVLGDAPTALSVTRIRRGLPSDRRPSLGELKSQLKQMTESGRIWSFYSPNRTTYWAAFDPAEHARSQILATLDRCPLTLAQLKDQVKGLPGYDRTQKPIQRHLEPLLDQGRVFEHPPLGPQRKPRFALQPPEPAPYLAPLAEDLERTGRKLGLSRKAVYLALGSVMGFNITSKTTAPEQPASPRAVRPPSATTEQRVIEAAVKVKPAAAQGALASIRDVRRAAALPKTEFDRAVLNLARQGRIKLHFHDYPASLSPQQRDDLVRDEAGRYYVGLVIQERI
jgi:hypothetical protein